MLIKIILILLLSCSSAWAAQYARPDVDVQTTGWQTAPCYEDIDEEIADDGATMCFISYDAENTLIVGLGDVTDPVSAINHTIRFRAQSIGGSKGKEVMQCFLYENGTLRASSANETLDRDTWTTFTYTLSEAEANSISNYNNLRLHFTPAHGSGSEGDVIGLDWAEFEVPDVSAGRARRMF